MSVPRSTVEQRKALPLATGVLDYFPDALLVVAEVSRVGNEQHHPGEPLHWDKSKSTDEADALMRHLLDRGTIDTDGIRHSAKVAWRALALLQRELDAEAAVYEDRMFQSISPPTLGTGYPTADSEADDRDIFAMDITTADVGGVTVESRGEWPPDTRIAGRLTCCGATQHTLECPQWR